MTYKHTGQGQIIDGEALTQDGNGNWIPATPLSYYPSLWERFAHFWLGIHQWTYGWEDKKCVMCGKLAKNI